MVMKIAGIGVDIAEISRFRTLLKKKQMRFVDNTFSVAEKEYCNSYRDPAPHFAAMFAAKEAVRKATGDFSHALSVVEVHHTKTGKPEIWISGKRKKILLLSITHSRSVACAVVINQK